MNIQCILRIFLLSQMLVIGVISSAGYVLASETQMQEAEPEKGPNRGRMLRDGSFAVELAIVETGVPPEFRVWVTDDGKTINPSQVDITIQLQRLGNVTDNINFSVENDYLRGDTVVYEPHSFVVLLTADYQGKSYQWQYDNFEGRTRIANNIAQALDIKTEITGPATLHETVRVYGQLALPPNAKRKIQARFDGVIKNMHVALGDYVKKGQTLITVESNESLKSYQITAPIDGVISQQLASEAEQTSARTLLELTSQKVLVAELAVFPTDVPSIKKFAPVEININGFDHGITSVVSGSKSTLRNDQARIFLAEVRNTDATLTEGMFVTADIEIATVDTPLAVKREGLQAFRDFTVVYAKFGEQYEVRMLELGMQAGEWVEVLGGIDPGTEYVTENSYIIKADIEKSGASHDH
ncbi:efflux RND transporter periplasmic adaptor subunit [Sessilibacter corallicola]|uniref:efflux RND transporter periplasmic adaptor subunit n=1 Tax=Sessilibacter corallicola TaxID=2904075 RepID=UPI001E64DC96|nr:HlyD family efflux transporter periplasmic adaptor subunit [Sessilibacter corallicola]MCE2029682.1 efflux RND transporter periplasmic adaptor subunit [Sessilibacter corallicola]